MKAFLQDPDVKVDELPPAIAEEFGKRLDEVKKQNPVDPQPHRKSDPWSRDPQPKEGYPRSDPWSKPDNTVGGMSPLIPTSMSFVVQRCVSAKLASDPQGRGASSIGPGLVISVTVADGATEEGVMSAARFVLTAKLSGKPGWLPAQKGMADFGGGAESVVSLCKMGENQGVMVVPQPSLVADIREGTTLAYSRTTRTSKMYDLFVSTLRSSAPELVSEGPASGATPCVPEIVAGDFGASPFTEVISAGPFMHSFAF